MPKKEPMSTVQTDSCVNGILLDLLPLSHAWQALEPHHQKQLKAHSEPNVKAEDLLTACNQVM